MHRALVLTVFSLLASGCWENTVDLSGKWTGEATLTVDGEQKNIPLQLEFADSEQTIEGSIVWDGYRRQITAGTSEGPQLRFESVIENDTILFNGLFRNDTIEGRFNITLKIDPEPFPGRFSIARQE